MLIEIATSASRYGVEVARGALSRLPELTQGSRRVAVLHTPSVAGAARRAQRALADAGRETTSVCVPDGEDAKTAACLASVWEELAAGGFTRSDLIVGVGGGALTDLAGFVAASWLRGVGHILAPTTVLAMVDAAVGGKTGINLTAGKNLVGAFHEPRAVLCDLDLLAGLPEREVASGLAEVAKCGFIADPKILDLIEQAPKEAADVTGPRMTELVRRAILVKADAVAGDLRESDSTPGRVGRERLNYGHTLGHAIEAESGYQVRHGEAVSVGMVFGAEVSRRLLGLDDAAVERHRRVLASLGLPIETSTGDWASLERRVRLDKKTRGERLRLIGLPAIGSVDLIEGPDLAVLEECFEAVRAEPSSVARIGG